MENQEIEYNKKSKKKKKKYTRKKIIIALEIFVSVIMLTGIILIAVPNVKAKLIKTPLGGFILRFLISEDDYEKNVQDTDFKKDDVVVNPGLNTETMDEFTNILLFGIDARGSEFDKVTHSDSIIIVSINNKTGVVKMVSLYRDSYLRIVRNDGTCIYDKLTNAYFMGGPTCAINTINTNLDLNIKDYAVINFSGLADIIDLLGGVDVNLTKSEMKYVNGYLTETRKITGKSSPDLTTYGDNIHLNGLQAVAYCRIRYTAFYDDDGNKIGSDYGRTARQRNVLSKLVDKAKSAGADALLGIIDVIFKNQSTEKSFATSMSYDAIIEMVPTLLEFSLFASGDKSGFPYTYGYALIGGGDMVVPAGLAYNVSELHEYLFNEVDYDPTDLVKNTSDVIKLLSDVKEKKLSK